MIFYLGPDYEYIDTNDYGSKVSLYGQNNGDTRALGNKIDLSKFNINEAYDERDIVNFDELDYSK